MDANDLKTGSLLRAERLLAQVSFHKLRHLFLSETGEEVELSVQEFIRLFHKHIDDSIPEKAIGDLFARVDANANDSLSFFECIMYIMLEAAGHRRMRDEATRQKFQENYSAGHQANTKNNVHFHKELINKLLYDSSRGKIISASLDGSVKLWNSKTLSFERDLHQEPKGCSITDICLLEPEATHLIVSNVNRELFVYNLNSFELDRAYKGKRRAVQGKTETLKRKKPLQERQKLRKLIYNDASAVPASHYEMPMHIVEKMDCNVMTQLVSYWDSRKERQLLYAACEDGYVRLLDVSRNSSILQENGPSSGSHHRSHPDLSASSNTSFNSLAIRPLKVSSEGCDNWISKILLASNIRSVIITSWDTTIRLFSMDSLKLVRTLHGHNTSIYNADYSADLKLLCTCGRDKDLYLWNPFISSPLQLLEGHQFPVVDVVFNSPDKQLISLGADKTFKVWDLRVFKCLQTFKEKDIFGPSDHRLLTMLFDSREDKLITGSSYLHSYSLKRKFAIFNSDYQGHHHKIRSVLYNPKYHQAIVADTMFVFAWDTMTGALIFKFKVDGEIVSATLDDKKRRVILTTASGLVRVYNYINGQQLKELKNTHKTAQEISALCHISNLSQDIRIVVGGGMEKKLLVWNDLSEDPEETIMRRMPSGRLKSSVTSCAHYEDALLVGEETGNLTLMDFQTGFIRAQRSFEEAIGQTDANHDPTLVCYVAARQQDKERKKATASTTPSTTTPTSLTQSDVIGSRAFKIPKVSSSSTLNCPIHRVPLPSSLHKNHRQVECIITLPRAKPISITCYANGVISLWNSINLTHLFSFVGDNNFAVNCMCTNEKNSILILGTTNGSLILYDISKVVTHPTKKPHVDESHISFISRLYVHSKAVNSLCIMDKSDMIISGSEDCTVSVITTSGEPVGLFGQSLLWDLNDPSTFGRCNIEDLLATKHSVRLSLQRTKSSGSSPGGVFMAKSPSMIADEEELRDTAPATLTGDDKSKRQDIIERLKNTVAPEACQDRLSKQNEQLTELEDDVEDLLSQRIEQAMQNLCAEDGEDTRRRQHLESEHQRKVTPKEVPAPNETQKQNIRKQFHRQFNDRNYNSRLNAFREIEKVQLPRSMRFGS